MARNEPRKDQPRQASVIQITVNFSPASRKYERKHDIERDIGEQEDQEREHKAMRKSVEAG